VLTPEEKASFGWLGRIPQDVLDAGPSITAEWKRLVASAGKVTRMRKGPERTQAAKEIETLYHDLTRRAAMQVRGRKENAA
jgi:hypothetical protein